NPQFSAFLAGTSPQALISPDTLDALRVKLDAAHLPAAQVTQTIAAITEPIKPALGAATTEAFLIGAIVLAISVLFVVFIPEIALRRRTARAAASTESRAIEGAPEALSPDLVLEKQAPR